MRPMQLSESAPGCMTAAAARAVALRFRCHGPDDVSRPAVQAFIATVYARRFDARIAVWAPTLVSLEHDGEIVAAAGYRSGVKALFLERYLAQPIEDAIAARCGAAIARSEIAEIGHLAATRAGSARPLMVAMAELLRAQGFGWAAMTATAGLRAIFARLHVQSLALGAAEASALGQAAELWGSYYDHAPQVIAGKIAGNFERLQMALRR